MAMMIDGEFGEEADAIEVLKYSGAEGSLRAKLIAEGNARKFSPFDIEAFRAEFVEFLRNYFADEFSFAANAAGERGYDQAYEHLARYGEWLGSDEPVLVKVDDE